MVSMKADNCYIELIMQSSSDRTPTQQSREGRQRLIYLGSCECSCQGYHSDSNHSGERSDQYLSTPEAAEVRQ
jgi:hypothetical protein